MKEKVNMKSSHEETQSRYKVVKQRSVKRLFYLIVPIISLLGFTGGVVAYYGHQSEINERVLALKDSSEALALEGHYEQALVEIEEGLKLRPTFEVLSQNQAAIEQASTYASTIKEVSGLLSEQKFQSAEEKLTNVRKLVQEEEGPLFIPLQKKINEIEESIKVGEIKKELDQLNNVDILSEKLTIVSAFTSDDAKSVQEQISNKIVQLTSNQSESLLKENKFSEALAVIEEGLHYIKEDEKLISLKERIKSEKVAFEKAEQERIEKAMEAAAKEDLQNRTAAVEVVNFEASVNEWGDLYINGDVTNVATTGIYSIIISYKIFNLEGTELTKGSTTVYPHHLNTGETGAFEDIHYGIYEDVTVEIDNITWYLD